VSKALYRRWVKAEEAIYHGDDPALSWDVDDLEQAFATAGFQATLTLETVQTEVRITPALLQRWFSPATDPPSYRTRLQPHLKPQDVAKIQAQFQQKLCHQVLPWNSAIAILCAYRSCAHRSCAHRQPS
jgi:putative ATPase